MKTPLLFCAFYFFAITASAQGIQRSINFNPIDKDSLDISLNSEYNLIEDSCASIIRHTRFNFDTRKFHGRFTDVRKDNPAVILTEGAYSADGLKDGIFVLRYNSGNIKAKGNYVADKLDGKWEAFYESGKPQLNFEVIDGVYNITDAWDSNGSKIVDKGNGTYVVELLVLTWKGKLVNGRPDGTWKMYRTDDKYKETVTSERFKKGEFVDGYSPLGKYTGQSRISLVSPFMFPFTNAERMVPGFPCNMASNDIVHAHYKDGVRSFNNKLTDALTAFFKRNDYTDRAGEFYIDGEITTEGKIINLVTSSGSSTGNVADGIIHEITQMPKLIPATMGGKPITEHFRITLRLGSGAYQYTLLFKR